MIQPKQSSIERKYIFDLVKKIDLAAFIEREAQVTFSRRGGRLSCRCPMPHHRDKTPSFGVTHLPDDIWVFSCFGCGSGGTIIDFCKDYWSLDTSSDALAIIAEKMDLGSNEEIMLNAVKNLKCSVDEQKNLEVQHVSASDCCREVLRKYPEREDIISWVASKYQSMNRWLDEGNIQEVRMVGSEANYILKKGKIHGK